MSWFSKDHGNADNNATQAAKAGQGRAAASQRAARAARRGGNGIQATTVNVGGRRTRRGV